MEYTVLHLTVIMFITQIVFIWFRTINVRYVASGNALGVVWTGIVIHWSWLIGIAIGTVSLIDIVKTGDLSYFPVIIASTLAGSIGGYLAMKAKIKKT